MEMTTKRAYYTSAEVRELLGISESKAYVIMKKLRMELIKSGKLTPDYPHGKVPRKYFDERCAIED